MEIIKNGFKNERLGIELDVYVIDGKEWFRAKDVSDFLDYRDARDMVRIVSFNENINTHIMPNVINPRGTTFINEFALYEIVCKINKTDTKRYTKAREFQKWVFEEVLPNLRKNNFYVDKENINEEQVKELQYQVTQLSEKMTNFSNALLYSPRKQQRCHTFLRAMFPDVEDVYEQFLGILKEMRLINEENLPTENFIKWNSEHKPHILFGVEVGDVQKAWYSFTNLGMLWMISRARIEGNKLIINNGKEMI